MLVFVLNVCSSCKGKRENCPAYGIRTSVKLETEAVA